MRLARPQHQVRLARSQLQMIDGLAEIHADVVSGVAVAAGAWVGAWLAHGARPRDDLSGVEADVLGRKSKLVEVMEQMVNLRRAQQCLGRNTAPIEADTAEMLALDECCLHAELGRPNRSDIAARPTAEDDQVE